MDQAILVALVMLVCVLTMLVLGIPSVSASVWPPPSPCCSCFPLRMPWEQRHRRYLQASIPSRCWQYLFHTGGEYHE